MMSSGKDFDEKEMLMRSKAGDTEAFGKLVTLYMTRAFYLARSFTAENADALDLSQEAFIRVWRSIKEHRPGEGVFSILVYRLP